MKKKLPFILFLFLSSVVSITFGQTETNIQALKKLSDMYHAEFLKNRAEIIEFARINNLPIRYESEEGVFEMQFLDPLSGMPQYYKTDNVNSAATISTNLVNPGGALGLNLDGTGITIHEWDGGIALTTHQEFDSRVTYDDGEAVNWHSTHVAGTMIASGFDAAAKGMAPAASLRSFGWTDDQSEMASEAAAGALVSNHSYGQIRGWYYSSPNWYWFGDPTVSSTEDYQFGFYDQLAQDWDEIAYTAPGYLIVKSAGNDRGDFYSGSHYYWDGAAWVVSTDSRDADGGTLGYDCIGNNGVSKNILTVGAVNDIPGGYTDPSDVVMSTFSGWGPADDGRIKPDICTNGVSLYSSNSTADDAYTTSSGTSMAAPSATGSLALLQQHFNDLNGAYMLAATLKALVIHTADEAGPSDGPDYMFGWGLMNTTKAVNKITENEYVEVVSELTLADGGTYTRSFTTTGTSPIQVTIVWTDPAGTPVAAALDPTDLMLVNDLDLNISDGSTTFYPWQLDGSSPATAATNAGENNIDNVEMVYISTPVLGATYTITVDHDGALNGSQDFSMIISGDIEALTPVADFIADFTNPNIGQSVTLSDQSLFLPTNWFWSFAPSTISYVDGSNSTSQNPVVVFNESGTYDVSLTAINAEGENTIIKTTYITVSDDLVYCIASGGGDEFIEEVTLEGINNSGTGADGYSDYTAMSADLEVGETYSIYVANGNAYVGDDLGVWIDWNQDGVFDEITENVVCELDFGWNGTFAFDVPIDAQLGNTRMRVRIKFEEDDCGNPCGVTPYGEVEDYTINVMGAPATWEGTTSAEWANAANWSTAVVPTASSIVTIPTTPIGSFFPEISSTTDAACSDLTLETGATLMVYGNLTIDGILTNNAGISGLVIKSDASGTGSVLTETDNVNVTVERYLSGGEWHLIGAPVDNQTAEAVYFDHSPDVWLKEYDESGNDWGPTLTDITTPMPFGKGFAIWVKSGEEATASFQDEIAAIDVPVSGLSFSGSGNGFNLVSNPFTASLDWDQGGWIRTNLDGNVWVYDPAAGQYKDRNSYGLGSLTEGIIPVGQGFFIRTTAVGAGLTIPVNARVHSGQAYYKNSTSESTNLSYLVFGVSKDSKSDETWITFNEACSNVVDTGWDVEKFFGDLDSPQLFTAENELYFSTIALPPVVIDRPTLVSLNFMAGEDGNHQLKLKSDENMEGTEIWVEDLITGQMQDMTKTSVYEFEATVNQSPERFLVLFNPQLVSGVDTDNEANKLIYAWDDFIYILGNYSGKQALVEIFDLLGREIYSGKLQPANVNRIKVETNNQYLVVKLVSDGKVTVKKVFIR